MAQKKPGARSASATAYTISLLALAAGGAHAQTAANTELSGIEVQAGRVQTLNLTQANDAGSRLGLSPLETPASVQVLSGDLIRSRGDTNLMESITRATGVTQVGNPGNGGKALVARGFSGVGSVMQLYDGVQLFVGSGTVSFPFEPWTVDRVEVISGPNSVLYGTGAIGGTINVVPRRPDPQRKSYEVQLGGGSFNTYRAYGDATGPISDKLSYRADVAYTHSNGWIDRGKSETLAFTGALRWDATPNLHFMLSDDFGRQDPMDYYGIPLINGVIDKSLRTKNYNILDAAQHYEDNWLQLKTEWTPLANWSFRNTLYYLTTNRHWNNEENFAYQPATRRLLRNGYLEIYHHEKQTGDHADATWKTRFGGHENDLVVGFDVNHVQFQNVSNSPFPGSSTVDPYNYTPDLFIHAAPTIPSVQTTTNQNSFYAEDRYELFKGLNLSGGIRADHYELTRLDPRANTTTGHKYDTVSWLAGLVKSLPQGLMAYAQYSYATDPVGSLITLSPAQQIFDLTTGHQVEVGLKQAIPGGWGEWTLAAYQITKNNLLQPTPGNPTLQQQIGQQSSTGIEASVAFMPIKGLRVEANGTVLRAKFDSFGETVSGVVISRAGNRPPNIPNATGNGIVTWDLWGPWQVRGNVRVVDKRFTNNANTLTMPGYTTFDAGVKYRVNDRLSVDINLYNLADAIYPTASYNGGNQWILGQPRAVEIAVHGRF